MPGDKPSSSAALPTPEEVIEAVMRDNYDHMPLNEQADLIVRSLQGFGYAITRWTYPRPKAIPGYV